MSIVYHDLINLFIRRYNLTSYTEIGVRRLDATFNNVICKDKVGVDIVPILGILHCTSDEYFKSLGNKKRSIYLIDGDHRKNQVLTDINNALDHLEDGGFVICDDINPEESWLLDDYYCSNAWEAFAELRKRPDLSMHVLAGTRFGWIRKGKQIPLDLGIEPTFEFLEKHRELIMQPVAWGDLIEFLNTEDASRDV